jgi:hypothetical protein
MISDYLRIERALSGSLAISELNSEEADFCRTYRPAFEVGRLAGRMYQGYYAHKAAIEIAKAPGADDLMPDLACRNEPIPADEVLRKDGTGHVYDFYHYLAYAKTDHHMAEDLERVWIIGALIAVGDALDKLKYLNHAPLLELVRHLRNGAAHGNAFNIQHPHHLIKYRAHNRDAQIKTTVFEITAQLNGQIVLFDFMGPADVLDVLASVEIYLTRIRERLAAKQLDSILSALD